MAVDGTGRGQVVVGVDGSEESYRAVDHALELAASTAVDVRLVHAYGGPGSAALRAELAEQYGRAGSAQAQGLLDLAVAYAQERLQRAAATARVAGVLHVGPAAGVLREESRHASAVVIGSRHHGGLTGLLLGSVAVPLTAHADCPVIVVRGGEVRHLPADAPVLVGVDGTSRSAPAIRFAAAEAERLHCPLAALMTWDEPWLRNPEVAAAMPTVAELDAQARRTLTNALGPVIAEHPGVPVSPLVEQGHPAHALLRHAEGARMVVVGSRGRGGFTGLLLGSTSQHLLHRSPVDVVVVRH